MPKSITVTELDGLLNSKQEPVIIDVRDNEQWGEGHIPGAIHLHKTEIIAKIESIIPEKNSFIVCHCSGGNSGPRITEELNAMGYDNAVYLVGGYRAYKASKG